MSVDDFGFSRNKHNSFFDDYRFSGNYEPNSPPAIVSERNGEKIKNKVFLNGYSLLKETVSQVIKYHREKMMENLKMSRAITVIDPRFYS